MTKESELKRFGVSIPEDLLERFDLLVRSKGYVGRSEAIRDAMRLFISQWELETEQEGGAATLSVVYQHKARLMADLTNAQHRSSANVISTIHVHLTPSHCLEVLTLSGKRESMQKLADRIGGLSGVEFAKLFMFSVPDATDHEHGHSH
ncbi:MAG: nickel-responsive transcriptional regulator NikR [Candidatus Thorarchaeota archaeon]|jgi:CopG family nickel-responsive transcriptional regulator